MMVEHEIARLPKDTAVFVCSHVWEDGMPILYVSHDGDGDWQFLCGGEHAGQSPILVCLEDVIARDSRVVEIGSLRCNHTAERDAPGKPCTIVDASEGLIRRNISEHGWHICLVGADGEEPGFAYSIGMMETLGHPEIIIFGLPSDLMGSMINEIGDRIRDGDRPVVGERFAGLLEGADCIFHPVSRDRFREYFGYGRWYYGGDGFEALQCFWPGKIQGLFPWEPGCHEDVVGSQPDLSGQSS